VLSVIGLYGENFIIESKDNFDEVPGFKPEWKYNMNYYPDALFIRSGRRSHFDGMSEDYSSDILKYTYSRHMTMMYNTFFMFVFCSLLPARKIHDEINLLGGIKKNPLFLFLVIIVFFL